MKLLLALALSGAFAQTSPTPVHRQADLRGSMEHWVLMARPDAVDPSVRELATQLTALHERAQDTDISAMSVDQLETDFTDWKERFAKLCFDRRPDGAPNDYAIYRKQLETGLNGLTQQQKSAAEARLSRLKTLVDPLAFNWYVERSRAGGAASIPGWTVAGKTVKSVSLPKGWTQNGQGGAATDLQTAEPPDADPVLNKKVTAFGDRLWKRGGTIGACYAGVKTVLEDLGIVSNFEGTKGRDADGNLIRVDELSGAYQFDKWVENHPTLQKRKLLRIPEPAWPLEISDVVVWGRSVCAYSDDWGHIEMIYKLSPDKRRAWAVSDHSQEFNVACFKREVEKTNAARATLPALREAVTQAQEDVTAAGTDRKKKALARASLAKKKAAARHAESVAEAVSVYKIERPAPKP